MSDITKTVDKSRIVEIETPISKYLANLERRKSIYVSPSANGGLLSDDEFRTPGSRSRIMNRPGTGMSSIAMRLNFDDPHFHDTSMLHVPHQISGAKKRRSNFGWGESTEEVDVEEIQKRNSELERLLRQTQAELINIRASQSKLEHVNNEMKRYHSEKVINFESAENEMKIKCKNAVDKATNLENELEKLRRKEKEASETAEQQRNAQRTKLSIMDGKMTELQRENFQLNQKLTQETIKYEQTLRKLQTELTETEMGAEKWIVDSQILRDQLTLAQKQLQLCQTELKTAQLDAIKFKFTKEKYETILNAQQSSENVVLDELVKKYENLYVKEQRANHNLSQVVKKLQYENSILRTTIKEEMILQEQITSLQTQVSYMTQELKEKGDFDAERLVLREELKTWKSTAAKIDNTCLTPLSLEKFIRQLQNMLFEFKHENSDMKHNFENSSRVVSTLQTESVSLREQLKYLKDEKEKLTGDMKKMSSRLVLIVKDRDSLRELNESYEQEFEGLISEPLKQRISQLQEIALEYENNLKDEELNRKPCSECEQRNIRVESLQCQLEETILEKDLLSQTLANQTTSVAPEDETTGVKMVAFAKNPSMMTVEARLKECLAESEILKEKVRKFEEDTMVGITDEDVLEEKRKLEDQLRVLERKHEILTQAYDYETVQLQQACSKLFGFYVTLVREPHNQIRLQSTYSTVADHVFIFQEAENHDMMLLETPILDHFRDDIERFLITEGSIPGFLASVTITYTQGQLSQVSAEEDITVRALDAPEQHQQQGGSEIQIEVRKQGSSTSTEEDESEADTNECVNLNERLTSELEDEPYQDENEPTELEELYEDPSDGDDYGEEEDDDDSDVVTID